MAIRRRELGLPEFFWFIDPFSLGEPTEQSFMLAAQREHEDEAADSSANHVKLPVLTPVN